MLEMLGTAASAWREVLHVSEWTGMSAGVLVGLGLVAWFVQPLRFLAIAGAVSVTAGYGGLLVGNHAGRADLQAQWDAAAAAAEKARVARDHAVQAEVEAKYRPIIADLTKQSGDLQRQVSDYEKKLLAGKSASPMQCLLGADALRLRRRKS